MAYAAIAIREYGEGRICIHTDAISGSINGHGNNSIVFWRKMIEWTAKRQAKEVIRVGVIVGNNANIYKLGDLYPISVIKISLSDIVLNNISNLHCLYFVGLPNIVSFDVANRIKEYVENGGGLIIESPNRAGEFINVLSAIEPIYCYSIQKPLYTSAYWTPNAGSNHMYFYEADVSFMVTLRESDFSSFWTVLMSDVPYTATTTTLVGAMVPNHSASLEFGISYMVAMQNGIVQLETLLSSSSSMGYSSSSESSSSESSSSMGYSSSSSMGYSSSSSMGYSSESSSSMAMGIGYMIIEGIIDPFKVS